MADDNRYNGWANYETWLVALWIDNDAGSYDLWRERAQDAFDFAVDEGGITREEAATYTIANHLKDHHEEAAHEMLCDANLTCSIWSDLIGGALSEVNWREIAGNLIAECDKSGDSKAADTHTTASNPDDE